MSDKKPNTSDYFAEFETQDNSESENSKNEDSTESFAKLLEATSPQKHLKGKKPKTGDNVKAEILVIGKEEVFVAILTTTGKPSSHEGSLARRDFDLLSKETALKAGDNLELTVTHVKGDEIRLSPKGTGSEATDNLEDAFDFEMPVEGRVAEVCNGGFRVALKGGSPLRLAFCPISQLTNQRIEKPEEFLGYKGEFLITKYEEGGKNIVVSRRKLIDREAGLSHGSFLAEHPVGSLVEGTVKRIENFGAFIELAPSLEGLLHISEISWTRIGHPSEVLQAGQKILVKILSLELKEQKMRISLSAKQTAERGATAAQESNSSNTVRDPYSEWALANPAGSLCEGTIERKEPFGWFVKLSNSITGLLHKSKVVDRSDQAWDKWKVGDRVQVQIGEINEKDRRISLQLPNDPSEADWQQYQKTESAKNPPSSTGGFGGGAFGDALKKALKK